CGQNTTFSTPKFRLARIKKKRLHVHVRFQHIDTKDATDNRGEAARKEKDLEVRVMTGYRRDKKRRRSIRQERRLEREKWTQQIAKHISDNCSTLAPGLGGGR